MLPEHNFSDRCMPPATWRRRASAAWVAKRPSFLTSNCSQAGASCSILTSLV
ncbi:MAG: hypothetical protein M0Z27_11055 [Thermaerobacter sp.]|nr:hypothetical protein [Thermaerobacter sp.]